MFALRCTQKLLKRVGVPLEIVPPTTTRLGDWCANLLDTSRGQLILCVSERTLLPVLLPARDAGSLPLRLAEATRGVLAAIGIPAANIDGEVSEMLEVGIARTINRSVLGSMNDFAIATAVALDAGRPLHDIALDLMGTPCGPLGMGSPRDATAELFRSALH